MAKAKFTNMSSLFTRHSSQNKVEPNKDDILKEGHLTKMENNKTKYFVLRRETNIDSPACLEYYENINKFMDGSPPRKRYLLKDCYISRKAIERKSFVFALFINNKKCKTLIASTEEDLQDWLSKLHSLKREISGCNNSGSIEYQRIWRVEIMNRGLASSQKLAGECLVCLTNWSLWLGITENDKREIPLNSIKNYGHINEFFFLEVGRQSGIGAGKLWMKTEDSYIAQNMVDIIKDAIERYGMLPHEKEQDSFDVSQQRIRVNSLSNSTHAGGCTSRPRNRACSESGTTVMPRITTRGVFCRSPNDTLHTQCEFPGSVIPLTSSEEDNICAHHRLENEYVSMSSKDGESPSADFLSSPTSVEALPRFDSSMNSYLEMGPTNSSSCRNSSTPIPILKKSDSLHHEMSPHSGNSSATSATTSSDQMHDLDGTSGSESLVGICFGANELLDRPIRTSSVGSKPEQYNRKNSAPMLAWSSASHSWSGTSGTYFRNLSGVVQPREHDTTMMVDYSNSNITHEEKEKKGFWASFGGHRLRSNSKSSRTSSVKISDLKEDTKPVDIPRKKGSEDYCEIDYQARGSSLECKGYLPMNPPKPRSGNSLERKMRLERAYLERSPAAESTVDSYVDMSQSGSSLSVSDLPSPSQSTFIPTHRESSFHDHIPHEKITKKNSNKKSNKSKSIKDCSSKRSKSDPDKYAQGSPDSTVKSKSTFSAFTRIIRKTSTSKSPINILPVKPPSPSSSLSRRRSKDRQDEQETIKVLPPSSSLPPNLTFNEKLEEKMLFVPREDSMPAHLKKISELYIADGEPAKARHSLVDTPNCENRNYANLSLNISSPQISQYSKQPNFPEVSPKLSYSVTPKNDYLFMTSTLITHLPETNRQSKQDVSPNPGERSRSLSGPVAPVDASSAKDKKNPAERTTSASSSPTSRSPPVSPSLGSVSSLSEGGLSSASSTCTVVNVGTTRNKYPSGSNPQEPRSSCPIKIVPVVPQDTDKSRPVSLNINYASLDLTKTPEGSPRPARSSRDTSKDSNYCEIDFVKSEGLRNTSLARNFTCQ